MGKKIWMREIARGLGYHVTVWRPYAAPRKKKLKGNQPPIPVNQQYVLYLFSYDLSDADYVDYTARHLN